jgi:hypothetical protein
LTQTDSQDDTHFHNAIAVVASEILFNILPLIILTIVFSYQNKAVLLFYAPEWSLTGAIFFGQTITKLVTAVLYTPKHAAPPIIVAIVTSLIALGLVPSLVVFVLQLTATGPSNGLATLQGILFVLSITTYLLFGIASEWIIAERHRS